MTRSSRKIVAPIGCALFSLASCGSSDTDTAPSSPVDQSSEQQLLNQAQPPKDAQMASTKSFAEMSDIERFQAMVAGDRKTHCGGLVGNPALATEKLYPAATPPPCSTNVHGQVESLPGGVEATHWFVEAEGVTWHLVTAGNPSNEAIVFLHGLPETWYGFRHQMSGLSDNYFTVSIDQLGYGQSDKRLELDYSNPAMALKLAALLDALEIERFYAVGHDRGAVTLDYLMAVDGIPERVKKYVRMQQSGNRPHGEPLPPHKLFASPMGVEVFARDNQIRILFSGKSPYSTVALSQEELDRLSFDFLHEGAAEAISKYFQTTNFDKELEDRMAEGGLFDRMTMPVLFLQGALDPGQHVEEYQYLDEDVANATLIVMEDASHFLHAEKPTEVTEIVRNFITSD